MLFGVGEEIMRKVKTLIDLSLVSLLALNLSSTELVGAECIHFPTKKMDALIEHHFARVVEAFIRDPFWKVRQKSAGEYLVDLRGESEDLLLTPMTLEGGEVSFDMNFGNDLAIQLVLFDPKVRFSQALSKTNSSTKCIDLTPSENETRLKAKKITLVGNHFQFTVGEQRFLSQKAGLPDFISGFDNQLDAMQRREFASIGGAVAASRINVLQVWQSTRFQIYRSGAWIAPKANGVVFLRASNPGAQQGKFGRYLFDATQERVIPPHEGRAIFVGSAFEIRDRSFNIDVSRTYGFELWFRPDNGKEQLLSKSEEIPNLENKE
jgi:hypothetical protein